jgi:glycosyltransferase involved in cell wall biosynthesis
MRIAYFSPLNPRPSGICDYSEGLLLPMSQFCEVEIFIEAYQPTNQALRGIQIFHWKEFAARHAANPYDNVIYQIGNNPDHTYIYDMAVRVPGVVVLHEFNLHYLMAEVTIVRRDWDGYLREVEYNAGPAALERAHQARRGVIDPDYTSIAMNRRLLENSRAAIVHNQHMVEMIRASGANVPVAVIPHPIDEHPEQWDRRLVRERLGLRDEVLIGMFGFLKHYKRVRSVIQALGRLRASHPNAHLLLVGEEHPHYPLRPMIRDLGLEERVHFVGYVSKEDFSSYIAAADIVVNLRFPTIGETSGPLVRTLGMGRPLIVSDIGSFGETPDDICVKIPPGDGEVDALVQELPKLLDSPSRRVELGRKAREWACRPENTCAVNAQRYLDWAQENSDPIASLFTCAPDYVRAGSGPFDLTIHGSDFTPESKVCWNGHDLVTTFLGSTEIRGSVPAEQIAAANMVRLTVTTPGRRCLNSLLFPVRHADCEITSVLPDHADTGSPGFELVVRGQGFIAESAVCLNCGPRPTKFINNTELRAVISTADLAAPNRGGISVRHPLQRSNTVPFVIRPPRRALDEPSLDASLDPGFYIVEARLAPESLEGRWRMRVTVPAGCLPYGFHAGGVLGGKGAMASVRFHLASAQKVEVDIQGQVLHHDIGIPSLTVRLLNDAGTRMGEEQCGDSKVRFESLLPEGCFVLEIRSGQVSPACTFQLSLGADSVDQHVQVDAELVPKTVGFCAFSLSQTQEVRIATEGWTLGDEGASGLELSLLDSGRNVIRSTGTGQQRPTPGSV